MFYFLFKLKVGEVCDINLMRIKDEIIVKKFECYF